MLTRRISPQVIYTLFFIFQIVIISVYLLNKFSEKLSFNVYLQTVKFSTLLLLAISLIFIFQNRIKLLKFNLLKLIFVFQILILYFTMMIHTDIKAINSPTFLFMLTSFIIFLSVNLSQNYLNGIVITIAISNFLFVVLQVLNLIPVAQLNERNGFGMINNRPTGILFNAFAMGYGSSILFLICLYYFIINQNKYLNLMAMISSSLAVLLSETRTPLLLMMGLGLIIIFQNKKIIFKNWKTISLSIFFLIIFFPIITILYGNYRNVDSYSTLNGRVLLWNCVLNKWQEFIPFGVGVQAAFPKGFCSDDPWFANLRHPENMFLLNLVETGPIGLVGLVILFTVTFWISAKILRDKNALPLATTSVYFMCSIFYVPLFHYVPFLENRPADRGIYNFFLFTLLWLMVLVKFAKVENENLVEIICKKK